MSEAQSARVVAFHALSIAGAISRMVSDAVQDRRLSETEAALIRDLLSHTEFPEGFYNLPSDGGFERQERF